ncbi:histidinol-phosphate transaminase [Motilimonas sp. 1_MG-2023]|uniref:histidinol-phosphate transaminase n=1 Tax=Motilimonas TaxID=1914248 RepID=UPI0026E3D03C|nr:histidinol-phosphate transaminase [Motilimonas sp. 1_MG-2023]MDO6526193.1 histidinol-phosphate transaminase [Motilimonas sp. 1_MG-2023]
MSIEKLARQTVQELVPYESARRIGGKGEVWINANEAPDCSEYQLNCDRMNRYPEFQPPEVINAYASYTGLNTDQVLATRGADESIELLIRTFCEPGKDSILICPPTYGMYSVSANTCGVDIKTVPLQANFDVDYQAVADKLDSVKVVFLCAPNNPTGNMLDTKQLKQLLESAKDRALIVVDEAYIEFCIDQSQVELIEHYENLVVTRTLSKAFALASIRCGFTLAQPSVIEMMKKVIPPYPVPGPVAQIASQALSTGGLHIMEQRVTTLNALRREALAQLDSLECVTELFPATGNFILARFVDSKLAFATLAKAGIIARDFANKPRLENCIRITIGNKAEMRATIKALAAL